MKTYSKTPRPRSTWSIKKSQRAKLVNQRKVSTEERDAKRLNKTE